MLPLEPVLLNIPMARSYGLIAFCMLFIFISFVSALKTETYISKDCEEETLADKVYGRKRTFLIEFEDTPINGSYVLASEYFSGSSCSGDAISAKYEIGFFQLLILETTGHDLIQFIPFERNMTFANDDILSEFASACNVQATEQGTYNVSEIDCDSFHLYDIISCNSSIQPRHFIRKDYIRFGVDGSWCYWDFDRFRNLSEYGPPLDYEETSLEKAERTFTKIISYIQLGLMALSILGAFITILTFLIFPRIRTYPIKLICWLCLSILLGQIMFIIVTFEAHGTNFCEAGGAFVHYFFLTNFTWCSCLAFNFYQLVS